MFSYRFIHSNWFCSLQSSSIEDMIIEFDKENTIVEEDNYMICLYGGKQSLLNFCFNQINLVF